MAAPIKMAAPSYAFQREISHLSVAVLPGSNSRIGTAKVEETREFNSDSLH